MNRSHLKNPKVYLDLKQQKLDFYQGRIVNQIKRLDSARDYLMTINQKNEFTLMKRISRESNGLQYAEQHMISHIQRLLVKSKHSQDSLISRFGVNERDLKRKLLDYSQTILSDKQRITVKMSQELALNQSVFNDIIKSLDLLSPLKIMGRGYALVQSGDAMVRSVDEVAVGNVISIRLKDGILTSRIEKREKHDE